MNKQGKYLVIIVLIVASFSLGSFIFRKNQNKTIRSNTQTTQNNQPKINENEEIITVTKEGFSPPVLKIKTNTRVSWVNKSGKIVSIASKDNQNNSSLNLGDFDNNTSVQAVFDKQGTYQYYNYLNSTQTGKIEVQ